MADNVPTGSVSSSKSLQRISGLMQKVWYIYQEFIRTERVAKVWWDGEEAMLFETKQTSAGQSTLQALTTLASNEAFNDGPTISTFEQQRLLCFLGCKRSVAFLHRCLSWWLEGNLAILSPDHSR